MEFHVPHILSNYKINLPKGVNILLGQPVYTKFTVFIHHYDIRFTPVGDHQVNDDRQQA